MKSKKTRLYITIDTEMDSNEHWIKTYPPTYTSITEGIPQLLRPIWDRLDAHPIYFVSPEVLFDESCCQVLLDEIASGAIIGAHLHPEYIEPGTIWGQGMENTPAQFPCYAYDTMTETEKLNNLTNLIQQKLGVKPVWYRAARFGADADTFQILQGLGYRYDSSVTPQINWQSKGGPNHSMSPIRSYEIEQTSVMEFPVTILGKRWGIVGKCLPDHWLFYRWLRPTHMTYMELRHIITEISRRHLEHPVMMFHSMEVMIHKTPYVRTKWMQTYYLWRLEQSLGYAKKQGYSL